jgi:hypothetical protein
VALTSEGELIFEEDREGSASGARVSDRNFLNGARHSIYYHREGDSATLLVRHMSTLVSFILALFEVRFNLFVVSYIGQSKLYSKD